MNYKIYPISLGTKHNVEYSTFTYRKHCGETLSAAYMCFLIKGENHNILVDSGAPNPKLAETLSYPKLDGRTFLADELEKLGIKCEEIDTVILTHLHWDHCYNLELFPNAKVYVQVRELQHAVNPSPFDKYMYVACPGDGLPGWFTAFPQLERIDGDCSILPGIDVLLTPGHTPGQMSVIVDTEKGKYILTSDILPLYENAELGIPNGITISFEDFYKSFEKIKATGAEIIPGHDIKVMDYKVFG